MARHPLSVFLPRFIKNLDRFMNRLLRIALNVSLGIILPLALSNCSSTPNREVRVSVKDQKLALYEKGTPIRVYDVSTSKYGLGDEPQSCRTPVGKLTIARKIGQGQAPGRVFASRRPTREILRPNAPGRDPVVTRILWLKGAEAKTRNTYSRYIYIHGTPEERRIGSPASYGCVRMRSMDVIDLFNRVSEGTSVKIESGALPTAARRLPAYAYVPPVRLTPNAINAVGASQFAHR
jgi:hypothetical protein